MTQPKSGDALRWDERLVDRAFGLSLWLLHRLPFRRRVAFAGWMMAHVVGPLAGMRRRVRANLALVAPDLPKDEVARLARAVPDNLGRMVTELFSPEEFLKLCADTPFDGPGIAALEEAQARGQGAILVSGHFGNYDIVRAGMILRGYDVGGLYRPMNNRAFNKRYVAAISRLGQPLFARGNRGFAGMVRHLKSGNVLALLTDQHKWHGAELTYFGQPAHTALSAAQLALKYDVPLIPIYAIRQPDGVSFRVEVEAPVPQTDKDQMMQAVNDSLEAQVRRNMGQWLWTHQRWKTWPAGVPGGPDDAADGADP